MDFQSTALLLAWVAIAVLALAVSGLLRQIRMMKLRPTQLSLAPSQALPDGPVDLGQSLMNGHGTKSVLLFVTPGCKSCEARLSDLESIAADEADLAFAAVFPEDANGLGGTSLRTVEHQQEAFSKLRVRMTPFGVVLSEQGLVTHAVPVGSSEALRRLVAAATSEARAES